MGSLGVVLNFLSSSRGCYVLGYDATLKKKKTCEAFRDLTGVLLSLGIASLILYLRINANMIQSSKCNKLIVYCVKKTSSYLRERFPLIPQTNRLLLSPRATIMFAECVHWGHFEQ